MVALRTAGLRELTADGQLEALRMLADRRDELAHRRVQTVNRLQRLLSELVPGQRKRDLSALQAKPVLGSVRPRDLAGKTRRRMAVEELSPTAAWASETTLLSCAWSAGSASASCTPVPLRGSSIQASGNTYCSAVG